jgi:hypothetical protein
MSGHETSLYSVWNSDKACRHGTDSLYCEFRAPRLRVKSAVQGSGLRRVRLRLLVTFCPLPRTAACQSSLPCARSNESAGPTLRDQEAASHLSPLLRLACSRCASRLLPQLLSSTLLHGLVLGRSEWGLGDGCWEAWGVDAVGGPVVLLHCIAVSSTTCFCALYQGAHCKEMDRHTLRGHTIATKMTFVGIDDGTTDDDHARMCLQLEEQLEDLSAMRHEPEGLM